MPIYQTTRFQTKPESLALCENAIRDFVAYVAANERGSTLYYHSLQQTDDSTGFVHIFAFADEAAREKHRTSDGVNRFVSILYPELSSDGVEFAEYKMFATTEEGQLTNDE